MPRNAVRPIIRNCGLWASMTGAFCRSRSLRPGSIKSTGSRMRSAWDAREKPRAREHGLELPRFAPRLCYLHVSTMFSRRTNWPLTPNRLTQALAEVRAVGAPLLDLTISNPTRVGLQYDE